MRVIRRLKAGDFCAFQLRLLSLTLPHGNRNRRDRNVSHYAIEVRCQKASRRIFCSQSATLCGKPGFLRSTRMHFPSPAAPKNRQLSSRRTSFWEEGEKETASGRFYLPQTRELNARDAALRVVW